MLSSNFTLYYMFSINIGFCFVVSSREHVNSHIISDLPFMKSKIKHTTHQSSFSLWIPLTFWSSLYYSMQKAHAVVCNEGGKVFLEKASPEAKLMVNGDPVTSRVELDNNDRYCEQRQLYLRMLLLNWHHMIHNL